MQARIIYLARYNDHMDPGDNLILGAYTTKQAAQDSINDELEYQKGINPECPEMNTKNRYNYRIDDVELYGEFPESNPEG